jgi:hypothetical protein
MGSLHIKAIFLLLAIAITPSTAWTVRILNRLSHKKVLFAHCRSGDDDLGPQYIKHRDEFKFSFGVNLFRTTLFWCYMSKDRESQASFDVFWPSGDAKKHGGIDHLSTWTVNEKAVWVIRDDGIYLKIRDPGGDAFKNDYIDEILYLRWQPKR